MIPDWEWVIAGKTSEGKPQGCCRLKDVGRCQQEETVRVVETAKVEPGGRLAPDSTAQVFFLCGLRRLPIPQVPKGKRMP